MRSTEFLQAAIDVQAERGKQYDSPEGERSMGRTVQAFNAITGRDLTEADGWLFMQVLKDVRQWQNPEAYHHDSALDGVAYASLKAEALCNGPRPMPEGVQEVLTFPFSTDVAPFPCAAEPLIPEGWTGIHEPRPPFPVGQHLELLMCNGSVRGAQYRRGMLFPDVVAWRLPIEQPETKAPGPWIEWNGGECPVKDKLVQVRHRDGSEHQGNAGEKWGRAARWTHLNAPTDIIAYRLL